MKLFKIISFLFILNTALYANEPTIETKVGELLERLHKDGYHLGIFNDKRFEVYRNTPKVAKTQNKINYFAESFGYFTDVSFRQAAEFNKTHNSALKKAEEKYGVGREYIMAILQMESNFGRKAGERIVLNSLVSMYVYGRKWAYSEIKQFLSLGDAFYKDPFELKGSYAGAFGIAQGLPSSHKTFGVDFNSDGRIDPYDPEDAIGFVANYLHKCGFSKTIESKSNAIYSYNRQKSYVNAIMEYAKELKNRLK